MPPSIFPCLQFIFSLLLHRFLSLSSISDNINMLIVLIVCRVISLACLPVVVCRVYIFCCCRRFFFFSLLFIFMWCVRKRKKVKNKMRKNDNKSLSLLLAMFSCSFPPLSALISLTLVTDCPHSFISFVLFL